MYETLATGTAHRIMTVADLNIPYPPEGADPLTAVGFAGDEHGLPLPAAPAVGVLAAAALSNAGHLPGNGALFIVTGGVPAAAGFVGLDTNPAGPKPGLGSYCTKDNCAPFKTEMESCPIPFGGNCGRALGHANLIPVTTRRFDMASSSSATDTSTGQVQHETRECRMRHRALVDQIMRELAAEAAGGVSAALNIRDALFAVAGLEWLLGVASRESAAEENRKESSQRRRRMKLA
jgi:hypothetical protein